jgi:F-type H+-transporting ATPase subunit b
MTFNPWTFLFEALNFVVLAFVLHRLLYRPLRAAIDRRRDEESVARTEAEKARADAADLRRQLQEQEARLEQERQEMLCQARAEAEAARRQLLTEADQEAQRRRKETEEAIVQQRAEALAGLRDDLARLAVEFAERLLRESCDTSLHRQLALRLAETLTAAPTAEREQLRREWLPDEGVTIEAAARLDEDMRERLTAAAAALLGQPVSPEFVVRPELLAGVRLCLGGRVWDATLGSRLAEARGASA